jgi:hypothetical protein
MLVTVKVFSYLILGIPCYGPLNAYLRYLTFFMFLILPNHCYLFKIFVVIIMFILNFTRSMFYVNDLSTKAVLLSSQNIDGLYVLSESSATTIP